MGEGRDQERYQMNTQERDLLKAIANYLLKAHWGVQVRQAVNTLQDNLNKLE